MMLKFIVRVLSFFILEKERRQAFCDKYYRSAEKGATSVLLKINVILLSFLIVNTKKRRAYRDKYFDKLNHNPSPAQQHPAPHPPAQTMMLSPVEQALCDFCLSKKSLVIYGTDRDAEQVSDIIVKITGGEGVINGFVVGDDEKHYGEYCERPVWNISAIPFPSSEAGIIVACPPEKRKSAIAALAVCSFLPEQIHIFNEPMWPLKEGDLQNVVEAARKDNKRIIILGANREGMEASRRLRGQNVEVAYYVSDVPFADTFDGKPLRSMYDLLFEDLRDKIVIITGRNHYDTLYDAGWGKLAAFLRAAHLDFNNSLLLSQPGKHVQLDVNVGSNIYRGEKQGIRIWGNWDEAKTRIITLGGSTSDAFFADYSDMYISWTEMLHRRLQNSVTDISVAGAGIVAYSSSQELLKLVRDIIPLRPSLVISFSGVNDFLKFSATENLPADSQERKNHHRRPFLAYSTERLFRGIHEAAIRGEINVDTGNVCYGVCNNYDAVTFWIDIMRMMYSMGLEFGFRFLGILQPNNVTYRSGEMREFHTWGRDVFEQRKMEYDRARKLVRNHSYLLDYTNIFNELDEDPYLDGAHVMPTGNRAIAEQVHKDILRMGLLDNFATPGGRI
jgi:lysophospholipase L1-like esterase